MIDSLMHYRPKFEHSTIHRQLELEAGGYILSTFHRPANVDTKEGLTKLVEFLNHCSGLRKIVFAVHPRTDKMLRQYQLMERFRPEVLLTPPLGYIDFLSLVQKAALVITDSGGIQEETTFLQIPCITIRDNTERPVTVTEGTNHLVGTKLDGVETLVAQILNGTVKKGTIPVKWDGKSAERIAGFVAGHLAAG